MGFIKNFFVKRALKKEEIEVEKIDNAINGQILQTIEENKQFSKIAKSNFKLKLLEAQQQKTLRELGVVGEIEDEEEFEDEEDDDTMKEAFKNLLVNGLHKTPKESTETPQDGTLPVIVNEDDINNPKASKTAENPFEAIVEKLRDIPPERLKQLLDMADKYI